MFSSAIGSTTSSMDTSYRSLQTALRFYSNIRLERSMATLKRKIRMANVRSRYSRTMYKLLSQMEKSLSERVSNKVISWPWNMIHLTIVASLFEWFSISSILNTLKNRWKRPKHGSPCSNKTVTKSSKPHYQSSFWMARDTLSPNKPSDRWQEGCKSITHAMSVKRN